MPSAPKPPFELERLRALTDLRLLDTPESNTFNHFATTASKMMEAPIAAISLVAEKRQWFKAICGLPGVTETPRDFAFCAYTILDSDRAFVVQDACADLRVSDNPLVTTEPKIRSYAGAPLLANNGLAIGSLCVIDTKPRTFSEYDLDRLLDMARMVSKSLRLYSSSNRLRQRREAAETGA